MDKGREAYQRFLAGDESGLGELVALYNASLTRYADRILHDAYEAEDVAADTFLFLLLKKPLLRQECAVKTYLFRVAHHKAVDLLRRKARQEQTLFGDDRELPLQAELTGEDGELFAGLLREERSRQLYRAMETLHPDYAKLLYLLYFEDFTPEMAGKVLGKSKKQIANLTYRAKQALRAAMEREGFVYQNG